ncbi:MAG TPA: ATP-binding protein, partial [Bacillota bacterium]|nr:ATP-binding protein [Bacillota bacterium]
FTPGQIYRSLVTAQNQALWREPGNAQIEPGDIYRACHESAGSGLKTLATKVNPRYTWEQLILPPDQTEQLQSICIQSKYRYLVYGKWGFDRVLSYGKGLNVLFFGAPGTGKTMAAEVLAGELQLELYKVDLSRVVSKYIGETEKNLSRIFDEAESSSAILFFDEADALFGKRSEIKDAHDRYANVEIGYLLQRMESYTGIVILATNLSKNLDEAFLRRMQFTLEFPFPDTGQRERIWKTIFPEKAPLSPDVDYTFLAEKMKISGGNIKNIAVNAAFNAAKANTDIGMVHIMRAGKREYQKMGKAFLKTDFQPYYEWVEGSE